MACNCKAKKVADAAIEMSGEGENENCRPNILSRIFSFFVRLTLGIFISVVFLILAIPLVIYIAICITIGKQPTFNVGKFVKWGSKLNGGD